jgi:hypothetical protein
MAKLTNNQWMINDNTRIANNITNIWLKQNGLTPEVLDKVKLEVLQATKIATNILKHDDRLYLLEAENIYIQLFLEKANSGKRNKITQKQCNTILNISHYIGRRKTKANKKINQLRKYNELRSQSVKSGSEV